MPYKWWIYSIKIICLWLISYLAVYLCEKTFSKLKYVKSHYRSVLADEHLHSFLMMVNSNFEHPLNEMLFPPEELCSTANSRLELLKVFWNLFSYFITTSVILLLCVFLYRGKSFSSLPLWKKYIFS